MFGVTTVQCLMSQPYNVWCHNRAIFAPLDVKIAVQVCDDKIHGVTGYNIVIFKIIPLRTCSLIRKLGKFYSAPPFLFYCSVVFLFQPELRSSSVKSLFLFLDSTESSVSFQCSIITSTSSSSSSFSQSRR